MRFNFLARDMTGQERVGCLVAETLEIATSQLRQEGMLIVSLQESTESETKFKIAIRRKHVSKNEIIYLTNQLAIMVDAGVPLATTLSTLAAQTQHPGLKPVLQSIQTRVEGGDNLSAALADFPKLFDSAYINLVKAGEASGLMADMLERIANRMRSELETRQKVLGAMVYPAAMLVICIGVCIFLLTYVFPKLTPMFETRRIELPQPTVIMLAISNILQNDWPLLLLATALLIAGVTYSLAQPWGRRIRDGICLNLPIVGAMARKVTISRSISTISTTISAGVPVLESIRLGAGVAKNVYYEECWNHVADEITRGRQIHEALEESTMIPGTLRQMIASAESTGKLGPVLTKVSEHYDRDLETSIKSVTSLIEPLMVFMMGGIIGFIALAMLLPIFQLSSSVH